MWQWFHHLSGRKDERLQSQGSRRTTWFCPTRISCQLKATVNVWLRIVFEVQDGSRMWQTRPEPDNIDYSNVSRYTLLTYMSWSNFQLVTWELALKSILEGSYSTEISVVGVASNPSNPKNELRGNLIWRTGPDTQIKILHIRRYIQPERANLCQDKMFSFSNMYKPAVIVSGFRSLWQKTILFIILWLMVVCYLVIPTELLNPFFKSTSSHPHYTRSHQCRGQW